MNLFHSRRQIASGLMLVFLMISRLGLAFISPPRLTDDNLKQFTSVFDLQTVGPVQLIQDNVAAFNEKIRLIRNAKTSLDMTYYIYSDDESSSYFSQELLKAAHRGVKIRVLVDYLTNYKLLDTFIAIQNEAKKDGHGSIEFRLYGRPTHNIIRDAIYMTTTCENLTHDQCVEHKIAEANKYINADQFDSASNSEKLNLLRVARNVNSGLSGVFLSGVYAKSGNTLKLLFHLLGYDKKIAESKNSAKLTPEQKEKVKELIKTYLKSKQGDVEATLRLKIASLFYGDEIEPILDLLNEVLPMQLKGLDGNRVKDWDYFTDYLHHKLLIADSVYGYEFVLGGRNIENSYHMQKNPSGKYTFVDTDAHLTVTSYSGQKVIETFDRLWNFEAMVASLDEVLQHAPNDTQATLSKCSTLDEVCISQVPRSIESIMSSRATRYQSAINKLNLQAAAYNSEKYKIYKTVKPRTPITLDKNIDTQARVSYIENLPFNKNSLPLVRSHGSTVDREELAGKYIHKIWANALLDTCGPEKGKQVVYLHSAYVVFPTPLLSAIAEMTKSSLPDNTFNSLYYTKRDCSNVTIKIITNSVETTDLSVINVFARVQMHALLKTLETVKSNYNYHKMNLEAKAAQIEYYEYAPPLGSEKADSLHTKISVIGNNAIIGSANADVRSYMMDSNNAIYIENAPQFAAQYGRYLENDLQNLTRVHRLDLTWRVGAHSQDNNYISKEINILIKRIQYLLRDRKWAKDKYFRSLENIFNGVFMQDILTSTFKTATTFTNILPKELEDLQAAHNEVGGPIRTGQPLDIEAVYESIRHDKTTIDRLIKLF